MKKLLLIFALLIACGSSINAATVREVLMRDTANCLMIPAPKNTMLDMFDYYDAGQSVSYTTPNNEKVWIDTITPNYIQLQKSRVTTLQAWLTEGRPDSLLVTITAYLTTRMQCIVRVYNARTFEECTSKYFTPLTIDDFIVKGTSKKQIALIKEKVKTLRVVYTISPDGNINAEHMTDEYFTKEDYAEISPYLYESRLYTFRGKYRLAKP